MPRRFDVHASHVDAVIWYVVHVVVPSVILALLSVGPGRIGLPLPSSQFFTPIATQPAGVDEAPEPPLVATRCSSMFASSDSWHVSNVV